MFDCESEPYLITIIIILSLLHVYNYIRTKSLIESVSIRDDTSEYIDI